MASNLGRCARQLADVRQDIDSFLDPAKLQLSGHDVKACTEPEIEPQALAIEKPETEELRLEVMGLRVEGDTLQAKFEDALHEHNSSRQEAERRASQDASAMARLRRRKSVLEREGDEKKQKAREADEENVQLECERNELAIVCEDLRRKFDESEAEQLRAQRDVERCQEELAAVRAASVEVQPSAAAAAVAPEGDAAAALHDQIARLQDEVALLRRHSEQAEPDRKLSEQLRQRHAEYESELTDLRASKAELIQLRSQTLRLEQEETRLKAAVQARSKALLEAEETVQGAKSAKRDLDAFSSVVAEMLVEGTPEGTEALSAASPSPRDLRSVWDRLMREVTDLRTRSQDQDSRLDQALLRESHSQTERGQLRTSLATTQASLEESNLAVRRAQEELATTTARANVLRKALAAHSPGDAAPPEQTEAVVEELRAQVEVERRKSTDFEAAAEAKQRAIDSLSAELNSMRQEHSKLSDMEVKLGQIQRSNEQLLRANGELKREQERLGDEVEASKRREAAAGQAARDFDPSTTKILHFRHGPGASFPSKGSGPDSEALRAEVTALRDEIRHLRAGSSRAAATGDLECRQASRQLERFKKATKKYVQEFREGSYSLLGWRVEMKGEGKALKWHLTSKFEEGQELVFELRPAEDGQPAQFDLLSTPWGEQLQADRHAMAYLEVYRSIPGFLAHITADLLSRQTIPG